jgi:homocysteine S-methyltransferase
MIESFRDALAERVLLLDGAMGTLLHAKGFRMTRCFDELNLTHADVVGEVHDAYVDAGVDIIETNTYGANRLKLGPHGLADSVGEINTRGVELARRAAERVRRYRRVFVAGSVGPPGRPLQERVYITIDEIEAAFEEQIRALVAAGVDVLMIETRSSLEEARAALRAAKRVAPDLPVAAHITFGEDGRTMKGQSPDEAVAALEPLNPDILGANCTIGPADLLPIVARMRQVTESPLSVMPNAGTPRVVEGRYFYATSPEYLAAYAKRFIEEAGISMFGGCCGTTPEHIRSVRTSLASARKGSAIVVNVPSLPPEDTPAEITPVATRDKSPLARLIGSSFTVSVEMRPPRGISTDRILAGARMLKDAGVHAVNLPDGALASPRVSPLSVGRLIEREVGIETIVHWCCRDRNLLGTQSELLGAHLLGQRNILAITGDPPKLGEYPNATAVFDVDSVGLIRIMDRLNHGQDLIGKPIGEPTSIFIGMGCDPAASDTEEEIRRFRLKAGSGAEFVMTQPVFDTAQLGTFLQAVGEPLPPVLVGILPLTSYRNAEFYENEIPGMHIPSAILARMRDAGDGDGARDEGIRIAQEALLEARELPGVAGAYIMPPFGRYKLAVKVLEALR